MTSKVRSAESPIEGNGVFAVTDLLVDEVVLIIDDSHITDEGHPTSAGEETYCDYIGGGKVVVMQTPERYINHSCDPNVYTRTREGVREVRALRSIRADEEIAYDYSINGFGETIWTCTCHSSHCRHQVHSDFFHLPVALQRAYLPLLDDWFREERADQIKALERS